MTFGAIVFWSASRDGGLAMAADRDALINALDLEEMKGLDAETRKRWVESLPHTREPLAAFRRAVDRMHVREGATDKRQIVSALWRRIGLDQSKEKYTAGYIGEKTDGETIEHETKPRFFVTIELKTGAWSTTATTKEDLKRVDTLRSNYDEERGLLTSERLGRWITCILTDRGDANAKPRPIDGICGVRVKQGSAVYLAPPGRAHLIEHLDAALRYATASKIRLQKYSADDEEQAAEDVRESLLGEIAELVAQAEAMRARGNARESSFKDRAEKAADMINRARIFKAVLGDSLVQIEQAAKAAHDEIENIAGGKVLTGAVVVDAKEAA